MTYLTQYDTLQVHPCCCKWHDSILFNGWVIVHCGLPWWFSSKESACQCRRGGFNPWVWRVSPKKEKATHSRILTWESLWTEEPSGLQSMGFQRVEHDLETKQQQQQYSIIYMQHIFFIQPSVNGYLGCFQVLAIVNGPSVMYPFRPCFSPDMFPVVWLQGLGPTFYSPQYLVISIHCVITFYHLDQAKPLISLSLHSLMEKYTSKAESLAHCRSSKQESSTLSSFPFLLRWLLQHLWALKKKFFFPLG